jgi:alpha-glucosidase
MLALYRRVLRARGSRLDAEAGLSFIDVEHPDLLAFRRGDVTVVLNVGDTEIELVPELASIDGARIVLTSAPAGHDAGRLPGNTCCWLAPA